MNTSKVIKCAQCRKEIKSVIHECQLCIKAFHPSCAKIHKTTNVKKQLVACKGQIEIIDTEKDNKEEKRASISMKGNERESEGEVGELIGYIGEIKTEIEMVMRKEIELLKKQLIAEFMHDKMKVIIKEIITEHMSRITQELTEEIKYVKMKMEELVKNKNKMENDRESNKKQYDKNNILKMDQSKESYAQTVRKSLKNEIIVQPVNEQESESTAKIIKQNVNIMQLGASVENVVKGPKGRITLECDKIKDRKILKETLTKKLVAQYKIFEPNKKLPKVKIIGIEEQIRKEEEEDFIKKISIQNDLNIQEVKFRMKIVKVIKTNNKTNTMILEVDQYTHKILVERQKMKIGWKNCNVYDYVSVIRCFRCWGYSHIASKCKKDMICKICAGNHEYNKCQRNIKKCVNCSTRAKKLNRNIACDHEATDRDCESYKIIVNKLRRNIKYCEE